MSDISAVTKLLPVAHETFQSNTSSSVGALAATVPIINLTKYAEGDTVVLTIEPGTAKQATFTGQISAVSTVINCVWTEGNLAATHDSGVTVIDYDSATHYNVVTKALRVHTNPDGSLKTAAVQAALNISGSTPPDYVSIPNAPSSCVYDGQGSYLVTYTGVDYTDRTQPGTRYRSVRNTAAPTMSSLLNGINQYWSLPTASVNKFLFTDDFTIIAKVKPTSYTTGGIVTRLTSVAGFYLYMNPAGQVLIGGRSASNDRAATTVPALPLNRYTTIAATLDLSGNIGAIYFNGISVPITMNGTATALAQAGDINIGAITGASYFPGTVAQVAVFSSILNITTIRSYESQGLTGTEPTLVSAWSLSGNANDLMVTTPNNLASNGGVTALNADAPFGGNAQNVPSATVDYGIIMESKFTGGNTLLRIQTPEGNTLPTSGGIASSSYSSAGKPYGFPSEEAKWQIVSVYNTSLIQNSAIGNTVYNVAGAQLVVPAGAFSLEYKGSLYVDQAGGVVAASHISTSPAVSLPYSSRLTCVSFQLAGNLIAVHTGKDSVKSSAQTVYYLNSTFNGNANNMQWYITTINTRNYGGLYITADNNWL